LQERKNNLLLGRASIERQFNIIDSKAFRYSEIRDILLHNRNRWRLRKGTRLAEFIEFLLKETKLRRVSLEFPSRTEIRYLWGDPSIYEVVLSLKSDSYFTHHTAMYFHDLTRKIPRTIFLNVEQPQHYSDSQELTQEAIDAAFRRPQRISRNVTSFRGKKIRILNGMHTGKLGVIMIRGSRGEEIPVTNIERTLIDIVVRPSYSGGVPEVLKAYKKAKGRASIKKLISMLEGLDYVYPYHEAVGFYLEKAGYTDPSINQLRDLGMNYDFYLAHDMKEMGYSEEWRIFFPKGL